MFSFKELFELKLHLKDSNTRYFSNGFLFKGISKSGKSLLLSKFMSPLLSEVVNSEEIVLKNRFHILFFCQLKHKILTFLTAMLLQKYSQTMLMSDQL